MSNWCEGHRTLKEQEQIQKNKSETSWIHVGKFSSLPGSVTKDVRMIWWHWARSNILCRQINSFDRERLHLMQQASRGNTIKTQMARQRNPLRRDLDL